MTSQVAVANHSGVAVASDTVTTSFFDRGTKTIGNKKKIMEIGKDHRVLILTSGSVTQNGVTLTLLINEWSTTLGKPLPTLEDYVDSFITWMNREKSIHTPESEFNRMHVLLNDHYYEVKKRAENCWFEIPVEEEQFTSKEEILKDFASQGLDYLSNLSLNTGVKDDNEFNRFIADEEINLREKIEYIFDDMGLDEENIQILMESAPLILSRSQDFPGSSTFAFVGFGSQEFFAGNIRLRSKGFYGGKFIHERGSRFSVNPENGSTISAFAQDDAIFGFIRGIRSDVLDHVWSEVKTHVNNSITNPAGEDLGEKIASEVFDSIKDYCFKRLTSPLLDSIEGLDLGHLANLAESLVGMEATSAFGAEGPATVGGFIEVATIDRQYGVKWVKSL
jgi:hypothetical protein